MCFLPLLLTLRRGVLDRMGFQFFHVESYGRQAGKGKAGNHSVGSILAEASREPGAIPHVHDPQQPIHLFGCSLAEVEAEAVAWAEQATDSIGRKLRKDGLCLLSGVVSAPPDMTAEGWDALKADAIQWLAKDGRLLAVVEHADEPHQPPNETKTHRHFHFYKTPAHGQRFETLHPGRAAALAAKADGAHKGEQNQAYKQAMRATQDDFFEEVGARHGLTRLGPARRRLTRSEWKAEQVAALAASKTMERAEKMMAVAALATNDAAAVQAAAEEAKVDAIASKAAVIELATKAKADADKAEAVRASNAKTVQKWTEQKAAMGVVAKRIEAERADIERLKQRGGRIGVFLGSLAGRAVDAVVGVLTDRKGKEAARAAALLRAQRTAKAATAVAESEREATKRAELAKDAAAVTARKELRAVAAERDAAQRDVARLTQPAPSQRQQPPSMRM